MASELEESTSLKPIKLYTAGTMNGYKAAIILEELQLPYEVNWLDFSKKEQKSEWFCQINPNGRIPAIVDPNYQDGFALAESAAICIYLCERYDPNNERFGLYATSDDLATRMKINQWLFWQMSAVGPILGNSMYFNRIAKSKGIIDEFGIARFKDESRRLLNVLEKQLKQTNAFICGDNFTIADICCLTYVRSAYWACVDISDLTEITGWIAKCLARKAVQKGFTVPKDNPHFYGPLTDTADMAEAIKANASRFDIPDTSESTTTSTTTTMKKKSEED